MSLAETMESETEPVAPGHNGVLRGRYRIDLARRLDSLASGENLAIQAFDTQDAAAQHFAVISNPYSVIRQRLAERMSESLVPGMVELLARGAVAFSDADTRAVIVSRLGRSDDMPCRADPALVNRSRMPSTSVIVTGRTMIIEAPSVLLRQVSGGSYRPEPSGSPGTGDT